MLALGLRQGTHVADDRHPPGHEREQLRAADRKTQHQAGTRADCAG